eukprot:gene18552-20415_t
MELQESKLASGTKKKDTSERLCRAVSSTSRKFPLLHEGDIMPTGYMEHSILYSDMQDIHTMPRWDGSQRFLIQIVVPHGLFLLQANNAYLRDQWLHSLTWRVHANKYRHLFSKLRQPEELVKALKDLIQFSLASPLHDDIVFQLPLNTVSNLLLHHSYQLSDAIREALLEAAGPLLEIHSPTPAICRCFQKICKNPTYKPEITSVFVPSVIRILKQNTDFGKLPHLRTFIQAYIYVLYFKDDTRDELDKFIASIHTSGTNCPHPKVLPNLVAVSLAAFYSVYDEKTDMNEEERTKLLACFQRVLKEIAKYPDWLAGLSTLLQAVPFPRKALEDVNFSMGLLDVIKSLAADKRCEVHQNILPIREGKQGWIHYFAPDGVCCHDDAEVFAFIMMHLMTCCGKRKKTLMCLEKSMRDAFVLMAIRGDQNCIQALVLLLDFELVENEVEKQQIITALQTTEHGRLQYEQLCSKKTKFREMRLQDGPKDLSLPIQSTDHDLAAVLNSGSFGNLENLNLAFTKVTGACAEYLVQLPALLHLNLWSTQFDDNGLHIIAEHISTLQTLNLCETPVTDEGLSSLSLMPNLRCLNLNSTKLSAFAFEGLKSKLCSLEEIDIRYTEAW